jgi:FG-GAP repeat
MRTLVALVSATLLLGCDYHRTLGNDAKVHPTSPLPGAGTGTSASGSKPTLSWTANTTADSYEVQLDDSCQLGKTCDFPSPEIDVMVTDPFYVPEAPLPVPSTGPHRQTYCWRVRGCHESACGEWSDARCFVVGVDKTLNRDLNGDGYADLVVGAPEYNRDTRTGRAAVYLGDTKLPSQPAIIHEGAPYTSLGGSVATVGDLNGDGYGDYMLASDGDYNNMNGNGAIGQVKVFYGGPTLKKQPDVVFLGANQQYRMASLTGCGDLNGDGYDDLAFIVGITSLDPSVQADPPWVEIHFGGPDLATSPPLVLHGDRATVQPVQLAAAGDVNGDGYPDLMVSFVDRSTGLVAGAKIFYGGQAMDSVPDAGITLPAEAAGTFPWIAGLGDINGDGFADLGFGVPNLDQSAPQAGVAYVFFGGASLSGSPDLTLQANTWEERFGLSILAAGDINHDGYADFAVLSLGGTSVVVNSDGHGSYGVRLPGKVSLFAGGPSPASTPFATVPAPVDHPDVNTGSLFDLDGDGIPEILVNQSTYSGDSLDIHAQVAIYRSGNTATPARILGEFKANDDFGITMSQ